MCYWKIIEVIPNISMSKRGVAILFIYVFCYSVEIKVFMVLIIDIGI